MVAVPDARMELLIDGAWVDVTDHVRRAGRIRHTRGQRANAASVVASSASWTIESPGGLYSNRNPRSEYFGKLGRNTPARCTVAGPTYLDLTGGPGCRIETPDHASLDITGDIDVRFDAELTNWADLDASFDHVEYIGKFGASGEKSWALGNRNNRLFFEWSANGTDSTGVSSTIPLPVPAGRLAVRATMDVDNGAAGNTVTFYTAPTIAGPWVQLGSPVVTAGATSLFNTTRALQIGDASPFTFAPAAGRVYGAEVRNGIGGTVVAAPTMAAATAGATSFVDSAGRTWTVANGATLTDRWQRFNLAVPEWPPSWHPSGNNITATLTGAGALRRLGQGRKALDSALRRRIPTFGPLAYWPMEDQGDAVQAASPIDGVTAMAVTNVDWGANDSLISSSALPQLDTNGVRCTLRGVVPPPASTLTEWSVNWLYRLDQANTPMRTFLRVLGSGTVREWHLNWSASLIRILGFDADGGTLVSVDLTSVPELYGQWNLVEFWIKQNGANVDWHIGWIDINRSGNFWEGSYAGTVGRPTAVASPAGGFGTELGGMAMGHVSVWPTAQNEGYYATYGDGALKAWTGETAGERITRLADEESLPILLAGTNELQQRMGPQGAVPLLELLAECEATDGGILYEDRESTDLRFRDRASLYNQDPALTIPYAQLAPPLTPVDDDQHIRNDVTRQRIGGSSARVIVEDGPLSVLPPEQGGVGIYDEALALSMYDDTQPLQIAGWAAHLGTWDEARYPSVRLYLHKYPALVEQVLALDVGDMIRITDLPDFLPPGPVDLIVQGYEEELDEFAWTVTLYCAPAGPWRVLQLSSGERSRLASDGATLVAAVDADDASLSVTSTGARWVDSATYPECFPMPLVIGGEEVTATAITGGVSDAFGRTVASGWGTADVGGAWATSGGSASDYAVGSGYGSHTQSSVNVQRRTVLAFPSADFDLYVDVTTSATAIGASLNGGPIARSADVSNFYHARLEFTTGNTIVLTLRKRIAGTETQLATYTTTITHVVGTFVRVRFQGTGTALKAKVWPATTGEPGAWQVEATDSDLTAAASIGVRSFASTGNLNVSPQIRFDNVALINPQAFTVTRSVNGIVKSHAAGTPVQIAQPNAIPL